MKHIEEAGKGLINFANIGTLLIFLKLFFDNFNFNYLIAGIIFFISFYSMGMRLIKIAEERSNGK